MVEALVFISSDTVVSAAAPPLSEYCAVKITLLPLPEDGATETVEGI